MNMKKIILGELFCGAGGFAEGARQAGFKHVWGVDNHADSCVTFGSNQKCSDYYMDVNKFAESSNLKKVEKDHGKINGLLFGFPCNDFSLVGKNKKMSGEYGGLYKYACKALNFFQPEFFVAENVTPLSKKLYGSHENLIKASEVFKEDKKDKLKNENFQNFKKINERRVSLTLGVLYDTPNEKMKKIPEMVKRIVNGVEKARFDRAHFSTFNASSLDFDVIYFIESDDYVRYMEAQQEINLELKGEFEKEGIGMAYPTQTIYLNK